MRRRTLLAIAESIIVAGATAVTVYVAAVRPRHMRWGATDEEVARVLPGDETVPRALMVATRAVTINATPDDIWPWLMQIGRGHAGLYTYGWVERLLRLDIRGNDRILPEAPRLAEGDEVPGIGTVLAVEPRRALVIELADPAWGAVSWTLVLDPLDARRTRLLSRTRYDVRWRDLLRQLPPRYTAVFPLVDPCEFLALRKMLLGIKARAEALARQRERAETRPGAAAETQPARQS